MLKSANKGDYVRVIAESPTDGLKVGDKGYVIRDEHWGDSREVAVMFEREFNGAVDYVPKLPVDEEVILRGVAQDGVKVVGRCCWIKTKRLEPVRYNEIQWIE